MAAKYENNFTNSPVKHLYQNDGPVIHSSRAAEQVAALSEIHRALRDAVNANQLSAVQIRELEPSLTAIEEASRGTMDADAPAVRTAVQVAWDTAREVLAPVLTAATMLFFGLTR
ncbi:hypothetical protein F9278_15545 [Streptomyces phaeolivaceus]|uniref:Uncharacterized protein n=1 Tax=Streptomyces phaeolivaceus TaxID=2653200 RepID=A0A5P8K2A5_9ACTN|nr:hypothetical protein [Streptomyces phaeolivaceus]QFQ97385.1 hypothetical protein F9278_15545 [Streptomyces phaeolivaceus]